MILLSPDAVADVGRVRDFLGVNNPDAARRALDAIWAALDKVQAFPELGRPTEDTDIRQIVVRFGATGYVLRYTILHERADVPVLRIWHGREART